MDIKQQSRDEIYTGYGVPPSKVNVIEAGNLGAGTGTSQDRNFQVNQCGPIGELVLEKFTFALLQQAYGVFDWHLKFGEVDWRDDEIIDQIVDLRIRNGRYTVNKARSIIGEPAIKGGDDPFIVDRQAMVLYEDLNDYSKASVTAVQAKGTTAMDGTQATPAGGTPDPAAPVPPKASEVESVYYSRGLFGPDQESQVLEAAWRVDYQRRRRDVLASVTDVE